MPQITEELKQLREAHGGTMLTEMPGDERKPGQWPPEHEYPKPVMGPVREGMGRAMRQGIPMAASLANMHPALRGGKALFGVPAVSELMRQLFEGENPDFMRAGMEGATGMALGAAGGTAAKVPKWGRQQIANVITPNGVGVEGSNRLVQTLLREGGDISPESIEALLKKSVGYENDALSMAQGRGRMKQPGGMGATAAERQLMERAGNSEELAKVIRDIDPRGGGDLPMIGAMFHRGGGSVRASGGGGGMFSPSSTLKMGKLIGGRVSSAVPPTAEAALRAILAGLMGQTEPPPLKGQQP